MTLKTRFLLLCGVLMAAMLSAGGFAVASLGAVGRAAEAAAAEHDAADRAEAAAAKVAWFGGSLRGVEPPTSDDAQFFASVRAEVAEVSARLRRAAGADAGDAAEELRLADAMPAQVDAASRNAGIIPPAAVGTTPPPPKPVPAGPTGSPAARGRAADELDRLNQSLAAAAAVAGRSARHHATAAAALASGRLTGAYAMLAAVAVVALAAFAEQYRTLVRPLVWLRHDMQASAARGYQWACPTVVGRDDDDADGAGRDPVRPRGDREFRDVAGYFNGLARDLAALYRDLEARVIARSRELVRSERLASVGFLAAGVAHEINNPLGVISGYAELAGNGLRRVMLGDGGGSGGDGAGADGAAAEAEAEDLAAALDAQTIIRDEAFRCKEITSRLLSLARGGTDGRARLRLDDVARQVAVLTRGLRDYRDRRLVVAIDESAGPLDVVANPTEMKQVLLNLTVNALEAIGPGGGLAGGTASEVRVAGRRDGPWVEVSVADTGKGMCRQTLEQVFEPFFTAKRGAGEPGTGLGLSITHAIVENHGGRIRAESDGVGRGSRFVVRLPAAVGRAVAASSAGVPASGVALNLA